MVVISNSSDAIKMMEAMERKLDNIPWFSAASIIQSSIKENFDKEGRYQSQGSIWGGSSKWSRKHVKPWKILNKSGRLRSNNKMVVYSDGFMIINDLVYAAAQNYGFPDRNLGASPFMVVQREDVEKISNVFENYLVV